MLTAPIALNITVTGSNETQKPITIRLVVVKEEEKPKPEEKEWLNTDELSVVLGVSKKIIYNLTSRKVIQPTKAGNWHMPTVRQKLSGVKI